MKRLNIPLILDTAFAALCAFLLFFTAVRYYTKNAAAGLVFGIAAALLFGALALILISGSQNKKLLVSHDEKTKKLLSLHLSLSSDVEIMNLFLKLFGAGANKSGDYIDFNGGAYFFDFKMQALSEDDIAAVIKYPFAGQKYIYCAKIGAEAAALAENFNIKITGIDGVYEELKKANLLPQKYIYEGNGKVKFTKKIKARFNRKLCAPLFWSGAGLLVLSYFAFYPVYYIVSGSILLLLCAICLFIGNK